MKGKARKIGLISIAEIKKRYSLGATKKELSLESGLPLARIDKILKDVRRD